MEKRPRLWKSVSLVVLLACMETPAANAAPAASPPYAPSSERMFAAVSLGVGVSAGSGLLALAATAAVPALRWGAVGRPEPVPVAIGIGIGTLTYLGLTQLGVPAAFLLANDERYRGSVSDARAEAFRRAQWPAAVALLAVGAIGAGAVIEAREFGRGQTVIFAGGVALFTSLVTYTFVEIAGAAEGYRRSRAPPGELP